MSEPSSTILHIVRAKDLANGQTHHPFADPQKTAVFTAEKRRALLANPLRCGPDEPMQIIGVKDGNVTGRLDLISGRMNLKGQAVPCLWGSYLYVPPEYRSTLVGLSLVLKMHSLHSTPAVCGISQVALPLYQKLKWADVAMPRHIMLRRSRSVVERYLGTGLSGMLGRLAADAALTAHRLAAGTIRSLKTSGLHVQHVDRAPQELEDAMTTGSKAIQTHRSAAVIDWMLAHSFETDARNRKGLFLVRDGGRRLIGYFIAKLRFYEVATHRGFKNLLLGSLQDWRIFDGSKLSMMQLIALAVREISAWDADAVEVCLPPDCAPLNLKPWGFVRVGDLHWMIRPSSQSLLHGHLPSLHADWTIRPADGDNTFS